MNGQPEVLSARRGNGSTPAGAAVTPIRCLLVDDHPAVRVGLRELLAAEPGFEVLDAVATAEAALGLCRAARESTWRSSTISWAAVRGCGSAASSSGCPIRPRC